MTSRMFNSALRSLRGSNLEVLKFGMYLMFPIGWMYYFGTNLENRFAVPDFWPTKEQSHKIPYERDEIKAEVERIRDGIREKQLERLQQARESFRSTGRPPVEEGMAVKNREEG